MGIVSKMARPKAISQEMERVLRENFSGGSTAAGTSVSSATAMRQATVYSCVNVLSRALSQLPCHLYTIDGRSKVKALNTKEYRLIHNRPNDWMTPSEFKSMIMNHLSLRGNFYAYKGGNAGSVTELLPFHPDNMVEVTQDKDWSIKYKARFKNGDEKIFDSSRILHIKGMVSDGFTGVNPIQYIRESIGLGLAAEEFGARYFGSGTHPGMIVEHPGRLGEEAYNNLKGSLDDKYSGLGKAHRLMLLEEGMKAHKITIDPKDAQFLELRQYQRSEIVDIFFAIPLSLINKSDANATFASAEQFSISFVVYTLVPWLVSIEEALNRDILSSQMQESYYYKFVTQGLLRGSFKDQMDGFATAIDKELMNPNECRELLEMNPYDGGDEYRTRTSTVKTDTGKTEK